MNGVANYLVLHANSTQFLLFASIVISMWFVERIVSAQTISTKLRHTSINALFMSAALPIQIGMMLLYFALANWVVDSDLTAFLYQRT